MESSFFDGLVLGLSAAFEPFNLLAVVLGVIIGTFIGMLPGLGPMSIIAIMIPITIKLGDPIAAILMLAGVYYGAIFGGSTSSILINAPGVAGTVASSFDGYPLAKRGFAGKALTIAAIGSFAGGTIGAILMLGFAPLLSNVALLFHSAEYFAMMVLGLTAIAAFAGKGNIIKALMMTVVGLALATIGESAQHNAPRFTFGILDLQSGVNFVTLVMGLFALGEALNLVLNKKGIQSSSKEGGTENKKITHLRISKKEAKQITPVIFRQSLMGFFIGVMPGAGATIASFLGYAFERNIAPAEDKKEFGKGSIKGLAAPETANNAACTGSFVPLLTLGIPGSGTTAILLGAFIALNISPGPRLLVDRPEVFWSIIVSMYFGNVILLVLNLPLIPYIAKVLAVPRNYLIPFVLLFSLLGAYIGQNNQTELLMMVGFGVLALILKKANYPLPPLIIGFILGVMLEDNLGRALKNSDGFSFLLDRPVSLVMVVLAIGMLIFPYLLNQMKKRVAKPVR